MAPGFLALTVEFYWHVNLVQISPQLLRDLHSSWCQRNVFFAPNSVTSTTVWCPLVCCHLQLPMFASLFKIIKTLDVHLRMCWIRLHTYRSTPNDCAVHTYTLTHFETMPGADAEFEDQYSVILSALFDIHRHNPLNPWAEFERNCSKPLKLLFEVLRSLCS